VYLIFTKSHSKQLSELLNINASKPNSKSNKGFKKAFGFALVYMWISVGLFSCANIVAPSGGQKDEKAPLMISSNPKDKSLNVQSSDFRFVFDEKIKMKDQSSVIIQPKIEKFKIRQQKRSVILKLDSLNENTAYYIDFSNSISDITENNFCDTCAVLFSTGDQLDSLRLKIILQSQDFSETDQSFNLDLSNTNLSYELKNIKDEGTFEALAKKEFELAILRGHC
jgi:hypothetical protein